MSPGVKSPPSKSLREKDTLAEKGSASESDDSLVVDDEVSSSQEKTQTVNQDAELESTNKEEPTTNVAVENSTPAVAAPQSDASEDIPKPTDLTRQTSVVDSLNELKATITETAVDVTPQEKPNADTTQQQPDVTESSQAAKTVDEEEECVEPPANKKPKL